MKRWMILAAVGLITVTTWLMAAPESMAAALPSQMTTSVRQASPAPEQVAAERALVKAKLMDFGLTSAQAQGRVDLLKDGEIHMLAANLDSIKAGAAGRSWSNEELLLIVILVVVLVR